MDGVGGGDGSSKHTIYVAAAFTARECWMKVTSNNLGLAIVPRSQAPPSFLLHTVLEPGNEARFSKILVLKET